MTEFVTEWAVRVDVPHPRRSEKAGDYITHLHEDVVKQANELWEGWTPVYRKVGPWREPKQPVEPKRPQGTCTVCGRVKALTIRGLVFNHETPRGRDRRYVGQCRGSRKPPVDGSVTEYEEATA